MPMQVLVGSCLEIGNRHPYPLARTIRASDQGPQRLAIDDAARFIHVCLIEYLQCRCKCLHAEFSRFIS